MNSQKMAGESTPGTPEILGGLPEGALKVDLHLLLTRLLIGETGSMFSQPFFLSEEQ
ncbi:hypothetical protein [Kluyvera sichuanensis]|uniref:hypothetical protein n=1 Tax=Kluyvera sichuanensis TaxID=2725494 RepID=UPI0039F56A8C